MPMIRQESAKDLLCALLLWDERGKPAAGTSAQAPGMAEKAQ